MPPRVRRQHGQHPSSAAARTGALDLILLIWTVLWVVAGIAVAREVNGLAEVGDTVAEVGRSTTTVGETLRALPIVGGSLAEAADQIAQAGRDAVTSTREPSLGLTSCRRGERSCTYR